jgi:solute carrier family 25 (mitochondrial carnitine/acylcarnitine transporter), member 20/29
MGWGTKLSRRGPNDRIYFLCFETLMRRDTSRGIRREDIPNWRICLYGAMYFSSLSAIDDRSGEALWLLIYPFGMIEYGGCIDGRCG